MMAKIVNRFGEKPKVIHLAYFLCGPTEKLTFWAVLQATLINIWEDNNTATCRLLTITRHHFLACSEIAFKLLYSLTHSGPRDQRLFPQSVHYFRNHFTCGHLIANLKIPFCSQQDLLGHMERMKFLSSLWLEIFYAKDKICGSLNALRRVSICIYPYLLMRAINLNEPL